MKCIAWLLSIGWLAACSAGDRTTLALTPPVYYPQGYYSPDCTWVPKSGISELADEHGTVCRFVGSGGIAKLVTR